jgi:hypothetical protein
MGASWTQEDRYKPSFGPTRPTSWATERGYGGNHCPPKDLLDIVYGMRHKLSTDPSDKIIGLLGVPVIYDVEDFKVDYNMTV